MFKSKLQALDYPNPEKFNPNDQKELRGLVLWLEEQKIRSYKIEERTELRKLSSAEWPAVFDKYKNDLNCPKELLSEIDQLKWIVAYAIKLEFLDSADDFRAITSEKVTLKEQTTSSAPSVKSVNPFDNLDFTTKQFEEGVRKLAAKLSIPYHPNHLLMLQAASRVIKENLNKESLKQPVLQGKQFPIFEGQGMKLKDEDVEQAGRILRLLQIHSVRQIQTVINETIVNVQNITADPKTDSALGKVGF